jgi:predicted membrane channel-forming protein YqfA (hemolysin III family)
MELIKNYFNAEKAESLVFISFGIVAILLSIYLLFFLKENFWKGLAIPLVFFSIVQIAIGTIIYTRSPKDNLRVEYILKNEPQKIQSEEIPRMEKVMKNFVYYRYFEISMILLGVVLMFSLSNYGFWKGFGLGLFIQCAVLLSLDFFAEKRGHFYIEHLQTINQKIQNNDQ